MRNRDDIRIGTLVSAAPAPSVIPQILPHGFESFALTFWQHLDVTDWAGNSARRRGDGRQSHRFVAGFFGNPLQNEDHVRDLEACIDNAHRYGCDIVAGFTGAIEGEPLPNSMPRFTKVWSELAKRAEAAGVRIAFEN